MAPGARRSRLPHPAHMSDDQLLAEAEALRAFADREALSDPLTLAQHLNPRMRTRPHLRAVSVELARLTPGSGGRLIIVLPPQVGKTELAAIATPFWWLANSPWLRGIIASYNTDLAVKRGSRVRNLVAVHGHRYGLELERGSAGVRDWSVTAGGGITSAGVGGGITGRPAEFGVIDDPVKDREQADSPRYRDRLWEWYSSSFYTRLAPGAPVVIMHTRWHDDDLVGRLLKEQGTQEDGGTWRLVYLPAIARQPDDREEEPEEGLAPRPRHRVPADALGRAPGTYLTHPSIATSNRDALAAYWLDKRRNTTVRDWHALYQGDPRPTEGALVTRELMRQRRVLNPTARPVKSAVGVDPSGGGRSTAGVIGAWLGDDGRLYWSHDRSAVMTSDAWGDAACQLAAEIDAETVYVEANYGGDQARKVIRTSWHALTERATRLANRVLADEQITARYGPDPLAHARAALERVELPAYAVQHALTVAALPGPGDPVDPDPDREEEAATALQDLERLLVSSSLDVSPLAVCAAWAVDRYHRLAPAVVPVNSRKNKVLRAEPVAQQVKLDRIRTSSYMPELDEEWATWVSTDPNSPGRIDASVHIALQLLPIPGAEALVSSPAHVSRAAAAGSGASGMGQISRTGGARGGFGSGGVAPRPPGAPR